MDGIGIGAGDMAAGAGMGMATGAAIVEGAGIAGMAAGVGMAGAGGATVGVIWASCAGDTCLNGVFPLLLLTSTFRLRSAGFCPASAPPAAFVKSTPTAVEFLVCLVVAWK